MTVAELIEKLKAMPQELDVVSGGDHGGYGFDEVVIINELKYSSITGRTEEVHCHWVELR